MQTKSTTSDLPALLKLPGLGDRARANTNLRFTWDQQEPLNVRIGFIQDYLSRVYEKDIPVQVARYEGSESGRLVLTRNPLEALASLYQRHFSDKKYSTASQSYLAAHNDLKQSEWVQTRLKAKEVRLEESAFKSWRRLPLYPFHPNGKEVVTLWELPASLATLFYEKNSDGLKLWSLPPDQAIPYIEDAGYYPCELISWSVLLAGEPHLKKQMLEETAPFVSLIGTQVRDTCYGWRGVPRCNNDNRVLELDDDSNTRTGSNYGSCAFLP